MPLDGQKHPNKTTRGHIFGLIDRSPKVDKNMDDLTDIFMSKTNVPSEMNFTNKPKEPGNNYDIRNQAGDSATANYTTVDKELDPPISVMEPSVDGKEASKTDVLASVDAPKLQKKMNKK